MSKSRGTFISATTYAQQLDPSYLRYYYASKLSSRVDDIDLSFDEFKAKVDSDLVGKVVNIASRSAKFLAGQKLSDTYPDDGGLFANGAALADTLATAYENCDYSSAIREIMVLADKANEYLEQKKPWTLRKENRLAEVVQACTVALNLFRQIVIYLSPILPRLAEQTATLLSTPIRHWTDAQQPLTGTVVGEFRHMLTRVDPDKVQAMIEDSKPAPTAEAAPAAPTS
jgi:methionyl-tRNA synthetase